MPRDCTGHIIIVKYYNIMPMYSPCTFHRYPILEIMLSNPHAGRELFESIPQEYKPYFIASTDIFHDDPVALTRAPSCHRADSVIMCLSQEMTLSAASFTNIPASTAWDVNIVSLPILGSVPVLLCNDRGFALRLDNAGGSTSNLIYPLTAWGVVNGQNTFHLPSGGLTAPFVVGLANTGYLEPASTNPSVTGPIRRNMRVLSSGFEVINTTSKLYLQGSVCVYRFPGNTGVSLVDYIPVTAVQATMASVLTGPPQNLPSAVLIPGNQSWKAADGCYCMATRNSSSNMYKSANTTPILILGESPSVGPSTGTDFLSFLDQNTGGGNVNPNLTTDFDSSGACFTGLSPETTLQVRYRIYLEIIPTPSDFNLIPLVTPSLPTSSQVEDILSMISPMIPPGWPQTDNPKGEVWKSILRTVGKAVEVVSPMVLPPQYAILGKEIGAGIQYALRPEPRMTDKVKTVPQEVQYIAPKNPKNFQSGPPKSTPKAAVKQPKKPKTQDKIYVVDNGKVVQIPRQFQDEIGFEFEDEPKQTKNQKREASKASRMQKRG